MLALSLSVLYNNLNALGSYFCFLIIVVVLPEIDTKLRLWPLLALALSLPLSLSLPMDCVFIVVVAAAVCFLLFFHFNAPAKGSPQRCLRELQKIKREMGKKQNGECCWNFWVYKIIEQLVREHVEMLVM